MYTAGKRTAYRHNGMQYEISPYDLVWSNDRYYVLGYSSKDSEVRTYRVDRIADLSVLDIPHTRKPDDYDIEMYFKRTFQMYDDKIYTVELLCDNDTMDMVIDHFDTKVKTETFDEEHFKVSVAVSASPTFYAWVFTFSGRIRILSPSEVIDSYRFHLKLAEKNS